MPRPPALVALRFVSCPSSRIRALPVAVGLIALATMAAGISLVVVRTVGVRGDHILAPAGIALVVCSFLQWRGHGAYGIEVRRIRTSRER